MSEPENKNNDKPNEELIPKAELEKVKSELAQQTATLQKQVEEAKLQLLSPEYLEYLEGKIKGKKEDKNDDDAVKALRAELAQLRQQQETQAAFLELEQVKQEHKDFEALRPNIQKILETARRDMTIEEAYWIAKGKQEPPKPEEKKLGAGNEKPGGIHPPSNATQKTFKNETEAAYAAANEVLTKYGISGDQI